MCRCCGDRHPRRHLESHGGDQAATADVQLTVPVRVAVHAHRVPAGGSARLLPLLLHTTGHEPALPDHTLLHLRAHPELHEQGRQVQSASAHGCRRCGRGDCSRCDDPAGRGQDAVEYPGDGHRADEGHVAGSDAGEEEGGDFHAFVI